MNVTLVAPRFPPHFDGVGDHAYAVANALTDAGHRVHVLTAGGKTATGAFRLTSLGTAWNTLATLRGCWFLARSREDVLLLEYTPFLFGVASPAPIALAWFARLLRIPCVVIAHEIFHDASTAALSLAGKRYFAARDTAVLLAADRIAAPSEQRRQRILAHLPRVADRIELVPIAANCEPPPAYVRAPDESEGFEVLAFGIVMPRRRFELAIDALAVARQSIDARLTIVGRIADADYARQCRDHAIARGVGRSVTFTGGIDAGEVTQRMARAGMSMFTAREGCTGSSGSLLALLAHAVPIVAARTEHDDARFAAVVAQSDAEATALGEQIVALSRDRSAAAELGKRGAALYHSDLIGPRSGADSSTEPQEVHVQASLSHKARVPGVVAAALASAAGIGALGAFGSIPIFAALAYAAVLIATMAMWTAGVPALLVLSTLDGFVKHFAPDAPGVYVIKDVLLGAILLGMLIHVAVRRELYAKMRWYGILPWALFVAYMASQIVHPPFGFSGSIAGFRARAFFAVLYIVGAIYFVKRERLIPIANLVIGLSVFAAAIGLIQHAMGATWMHLGPGFATASLHYTTFIPNGDPSLTQEARLAFRSYGTLVDPASLGLFCSLGMLFAMTALSRTKSKRTRFILFASMGVIAVCLFDTGTRAAMIGLGVGILVIVGFMVAEKRLRVSTLIGLLLIVGIGAAVVFTTRSALTDRTTSSASVAYALQTRTRSNTIVFDEVGQYPLGHGLGSTGAGGALRKEPGLAIDNTFLAYTYETGPIGLAIFLLVQFTFMGLGIRAAMAETPYRSVFLGFVAAQCALLVAGLATQGIFDYAPMAQIFWLFCGALALPWSREAVGVRDAVAQPAPPSLVYGVRQ